MAEPGQTKSGKMPWKSNEIRMTKLFNELFELGELITVSELRMLD